MGSFVSRGEDEEESEELESLQIPAILEGPAAPESPLASSRASEVADDHAEALQALTDSPAAATADEIEGSAEILMPVSADMAAELASPPQAEMPESNQTAEDVVLLA